MILATPGGGRRAAPRPAGRALFLALAGALALPVARCQQGEDHSGAAPASSASAAATEDPGLEELSRSLGPEFRRALERNRREHLDDCRRSCELYYCEPDDEGEGEGEEGRGRRGGAAVRRDDDASGAEFASISMGSVPPEDLADAFLMQAGNGSRDAAPASALDLIKVSKAPLFSREELEQVLKVATEQEGLDHHEYVSGKYRLGGNYLDELPRTRAWFNERLRTTIFPLFRRLFPSVVSSTKVLRARSASLLKYNASHPRTDVHVDNGVLAFTLAMNPIEEYEGGGTHYEHLPGGDPRKPAEVEMDAGVATLRPGSVRHGGRRVTNGTRYVLGCFLLLEDRVEHVRRLKNRGSDRRRRGRLDEAARHFEWALAINPRCATCLKDLAEVRLVQRRLDEAEAHLRRALELLNYRDSDALFSLGLVLSEQGGRDDESIRAYRQSLALNGEDAELCYNLAIKLGSMGLAGEEAELYARAVAVDPRMAGAWLNWGTALAEAGDADGAEAKFERALDVATGSSGPSSPPQPPQAPTPRSGLCARDTRLDDRAVAAKAALNLALLHTRRGERLARSGDLEGARAAASRASGLADGGRSGLDALLRDLAGAGRQRGRQQVAEGLLPHAAQCAPLRLRIHRLAGQLLAASGDLDGAEAEFRRAAEAFPLDPAAWAALSRVLEVRGKDSEAAAAGERAASLRSQEPGQ